MRPDRPFPVRLLFQEAVSLPDQDGMSLVWERHVGRIFNIQDTADMLVDTVGMSTLVLPDLPYHFHGMDLNWGG